MLKGVVLAGRYRLDRELGSGGMGRVWKGHDLRMDRPIAVKLLLSLGSVEEGIRRRFDSEARTGGRVQHPGITVVHDVGSHEGSPFIVMELLAGVSLKTLIDRRRSGLDVEDVLRFGRQLSEGLAAAHRNGIVHRDVKPSNVMVVDGRAKLCDFGIARLTGDGPVDGTRGIGSPPFMAPEQFDGRVDARADLYSLGCLIHTACVGVPPFIGNNPMNIVYQHGHVPAESMRGRRPDLPRRLDDLVLRLLAKDPAGRPQTAQEVAGELLAITRERRTEREPEPGPLFVGRPSEMVAARSQYELPPVGSLSSGTPPRARTPESEAVVRGLRELMRGERVDATVGGVSRGPVVTRYEVRLGPSASVSQMRGFAARAAAALEREVAFVSRIPSTASLPDVPAVGLDVVNAHRDLVCIGDLLRDCGVRGAVTVGLCRGTSGDVVIDLASLPHLLIAGGRDDSDVRVVESILISMLTTTTPDDLCLIMADPTGIGLRRYEGVPHVYQAVSATPEQALGALEAAALEMDGRYAAMAAAGHRSLDDYNAAVLNGDVAPPAVRFGVGAGPGHPRLVLVLADLAAPMRVNADRTLRSLAKITQRGRAAGVHLVVTAPCVGADVLPRRARSGFGGRLVLATRSAEESVLLGSPGAERLLDRGDALFRRLGATGTDRVQCATATPKDVEAVIGHWRSRWA